MKGNVRPVIAGLALCLLMLAACSSPSPTPATVVETPAPAETATPTPAPTATSVFIPVPTEELVMTGPTPVVVSNDPDPSTPGPLPEATPADVIEFYTGHYGAAPATVGQRIYFADVIVRASLVSKTSTTLTFRALEYLKGTGPQQFTVPAAAGRNTQWDNMDAILFLTTESDGGVTASSNQPVVHSPANTPSSTTFNFIDTTFRENLSAIGDQVIEYHGHRPEGNTVDSSNPVWLPATTSGIAEQGGSGDIIPPDEYIALAGNPQKLITLSELKEKIAWITGGAGIDGYQECIRSALALEQDRRDEVAAGLPPVPDDPTTLTISSSDPAGTVVFSFPEMRPREDKFWLEGPDKELFTHGFGDGDSEIGFYVRTARPLPAGTYRYTWNLQFKRHIPCDFTHVPNPTRDIVTSTAPAGTIYEAWFETIDVGVIGAAPLNNQGRIDPSTFTINGTSTFIQGFMWTGSEIVLGLDPIVSLSGHTIDVVRNDGTVFSLSGADGTTSGNRITWSPHTNAPFNGGEKMLLRIRENQ